MQNRYIWGALLLVSFVFCVFMSCLRGACAYEVKEANLVFCDTTEQVETFIHFKGDTEVAIAWLNTEKPASCAYRPIRFYDGGEVKKVQTYDGLYSINKIAVLEVLGEHEWVTGFPMIQYVAVQPDTSLLIRVQDHHRHHNSYQNWSSGVTENCCNNQDCSDIPEERVRESANGTSIEISGQWCPVEQKHRIKKGQSPDWSKYHACVQLDHDKWSLPNGTVGRKAPCDRLLCFVTKGGGI